MWKESTYLGAICVAWWSLSHVALTWPCFSACSACATRLSVGKHYYASSATAQSMQACPVCPRAPPQALGRTAVGVVFSSWLLRPLFTTSWSLAIFPLLGITKFCLKGRNRLFLDRNLAPSRLLYLHSCPLSLKTSPVSLEPLICGTATILLKSLQFSGITDQKYVWGGVGATWSISVLLFIPPGLVLRKKASSLH